MRGHNLYPIGLITIVIGFLLIYFRTALADGGVVIAAGILFVLAGLLNILYSCATARMAEAREP